MVIAVVWARSSPVRWSQADASQELDLWDYITRQKTREDVQRCSSQGSDKLLYNEIIVLESDGEAANLNRFHAITSTGEKNRVRSTIVDQQTKQPHSSLTFVQSYYLSASFANILPLTE